MNFRAAATISLVVVMFLTFFPSQAIEAELKSSRSFHVHPFELNSSPFSAALETLQKEHLNYTFWDIDLLRRAMTHSSYSMENNGALSILGVDLIEASVSLRALKEDVDMSAKDVNNRISEIVEVKSSCAVSGMKLGLQKLIRVSQKTDPSTPSVVCGAYRAIFGAIAVDAGSLDDAGAVFWRVHGEKIGNALSM